jgi:hypothetical protein
MYSTSTSAGAEMPAKAEGRMRERSTQEEANMLVRICPVTNVIP